MKQYIFVLCIIYLQICYVISNIHGGMLFPKESESRQIQDLNGMWNFRADFSVNRKLGFTESWFSQPLSKSGKVIAMPVPSSFNDITVDKKLRDFVGWVWYDKEIFVSSDWINKRVILRIDSAHYFAIAWINGKEVVSHNGGHLPFEIIVNNVTKFGESNLLTIAVNNTLTPLTLPPGKIIYPEYPHLYPPGYFTSKLQFDFFNYAGLHRSVRLYTTPNVYIDDITIKTININQGYATLDYDIKILPSNIAIMVAISILQKDGYVVETSNLLSNKLQIKNPILWWPYSMNSTNFGYQYILKVMIKNNITNEVDVYRQKFGIRTIKWTQTMFFINDQPFYCHGVAKHEDYDIRGKGLDLVSIAHDFQMLKWLGANCFRTSHYPYAEEIMDQADDQGIAVIDESPGVGIMKENMGPDNLKHHLDVMQELVRRDKNRPSVIIWSVANEPESDVIEAENYFKNLINFTHCLDSTRPVSFAESKGYNTCRAAQFVDILFINRYFAWYSDLGHIEVIPYKLPIELDNWFEKFKRPIIITEYGADTVSGIHTEPGLPFSEEYQARFLQSYHNVFDNFKKKYLIGEMVWNFADFMTDYDVTRVNGNKKGLLTRQRNPKFSAHIIRSRYWNFMNNNKKLNFKDFNSEFLSICKPVV